MTQQLMRKSLASGSFSPFLRNYAPLGASRGGKVVLCSIPGQQRCISSSNKKNATTNELNNTPHNVWFASNVHLAFPQGSSLQPNDVRPPDERTLRLGKTIQILHDRLPKLLATPLPQEILSPQITLHLFPSTHPHLPTVSGKIAYNAALWTAPVAWGRVPVLGNVRLIILSERMVRNGTSTYISGKYPPSLSSSTHSPYTYPNEKLIVRWRTCGKTHGRGVGSSYRGISGSGDQVDKITEFLGGDVRDDEEFEGLFIFEFDEMGRVAKHTIEHAQEGRNCERMSRVVSVTDWLLGLAKGGRREEEGLALGFVEGEEEGRRRWMREGRREE